MPKGWRLNGHEQRKPPGELLERLLDPEISDDETTAIVNEISKRANELTEENIHQLIAMLASPVPAAQFGALSIIGYARTASGDKFNISHVIHLLTLELTDAAMFIIIPLLLSNLINGNHGIFKGVADKDV